MAPTVSAGADPRPIAPRIGHIALRGVDASVLRSAQGARSDAAIEQEVSASSTGDAVAAPRLVVLTAPRTGAEFDTVGVSWKRVDGDAPIVVAAVRTRSDGRWGEWTALSQEEDPTGETAPRSGTEPLFAGRSDGVQARVEVVPGVVPTDLRVDIVDPGGSDYDAVAGKQPRGAASAAAAQPRILPRAAWGADESRRRGTPGYMPTLKAGVLHHTAGVNGYSASEVPKIIRGDYAYHLSRGWNDIGYNFLVDRFGRTWEGRAGGVDAAVVGAHAGGFNASTFGVSMIGNYDEVKPSAAAVEAVARLFAWKLDLYHRDPHGTTRLTSAGGGTAKYAAGRTVTLPVVMGHRNVGNTACPGKYLYAQLGAIRDRVATLMKAALLEPSTSAATVPAATGTASITATALRTQSWRLTVTLPCAANRVVRVVDGRTGAGRRFTATWDGRDSAGARARAGAYVLTLTSRTSSASARPVTSAVSLLPPAPAPAATGPATTGVAGRYVPVTPVRLVDTRTPSFGPLGPAGRLDVPVLGRAGVPATGVTSVVLAVTGVCPSAATWLSVHPTGSPDPDAGAVLVPAGGVRSGTVTVAVGAAGSVSVANSLGVVDAIVDVVGYHSSDGGAGLVPTPLVRVYDTRAGTALAAGVERTFALPALAGVAPSDVRAVVAQVTVYGPSRGGYLSATAYGTPATTSIMNFAAREVVDDRAVIGVDRGRITLRSNVDAHVAVDVVGVYTASGGLAYTAVAPRRALDTRSGAALGPGTTQVVTVTGADVPVGAGAVQVNLSGLAPTARTGLVSWPTDQARGAGLDLRLAAGDSRTNMALVRPSPAGTVTVGNSAGTVNLVVDVLGFYA